MGSHEIRQHYPANQRYFTTDVRTIHPSTNYPDESRYIRHGDVFVENMTNTITEFNARTLA